MLPQTSRIFFDLFLRRRIRKRRSGRELPPKCSSVPQGNKKGRNVFGIKTSRAEGLPLALFKPSLIALALPADKVGCFFFWM